MCLWGSTCCGKGLTCQRLHLVADPGSDKDGSALMTARLCQTIGGHQGISRERVVMYATGHRFDATGDREDKPQAIDADKV